MGSMNPFSLHYKKFLVNLCSVHVGDAAMIVQPYSSRPPVHLIYTLRQWNKETFDYLLSFLSSPECVKMGIFLQSGYNLLTERSPVRRALFFTENTRYKISEDL